LCGAESGFPSKHASKALDGWELEILVRSVTRLDLLLQFHWRFFIVLLHVFFIGKSLALFREQFTLYDLDV
jgi:hypothetical protein